MPGLFSFDRFTLDKSGGRLLADGVPVPLGSTGFRVLQALVENAGHIVTKDELVSRVWGGKAIGDNALQVQIAALRKIVGDGCIVTKQRRGYRFVPQVRASGDLLHEPRAADHIRIGNLPSFYTARETGGAVRLIGRSEQLAAVSKLLIERRLVTLTGPGGVGKTSLALQAAAEASPGFRDGAWIVELATLNDQDLVASALASVLGIKIGTNATPGDALARHLATKSLLIVMDNCEHVIAAAALLLDQLLRAAPGIKILATSREPLSCSMEQTFEVPPLTVPGEEPMPSAVLREMSAIKLFAERAADADAEFQIEDAEMPIAARICRRVDGLPLAIEMVAGWAGMLGLEVLDAKLHGSINDWLHAKNTSPSRHLTLRATLEWSHGLLSVGEQIVLRRLAAFVGTFSLPAAETVASDGLVGKEQVFEHVASLIRKSMISCVPGSRRQRYRLMETTRGFMLERLEASGEAAAVRRKHAHFILQLLEQATAEWEITSDTVWLNRYGPVLDDLRSALNWAMQRGLESDDAVALAGASWPLWQELSLRAEGRRWLSDALKRLRSDTSRTLEARLLRGQGELGLSTAAVSEASEDLAHAADLYRSLGDFPSLGGVLSALGFALVMLDRVEEADLSIAEAVSLLEHVGWLRTRARAYSTKLCVKARLHDFEAARSAGSKSLQLCEMAGADRTSFVVAGNMVEVSLEMGDVDTAISSGRALVARLRSTPHSALLGYALGILAASLTARGDLDEALRAARESIPLLREDGTLFWLFDHLALRAGLAGYSKNAALLIGYADSLYRNFGRPREPVGRQAVKRLTGLLRETLPEDEIAQLVCEGALFTEDQAIARALA